MTSLATSKEYANILPKDFLHGYSSASYQIEGGHDKGGRGPSVWDVALKEAPNGNGDEACNSFDHWREDVELLKQYGATSYRFSISWSRLIPLGGKNDPVNQEGIKYYNDLIDALLEAGITPFVTIFHWDLPLELDKRYGGFLATGKNKEIFLADFESYAALCFRSFGDRVKHWITHNEPMIFTLCMIAVLNKDSTDMSKDVWTLGHNLILSHATAVACYRRDFAEHKGTIGITLNIEWVEPFDESVEAASAAQRSLDMMAWYADPIYLGKHNKFAQQLAGEAFIDFTEAEWAIVKDSSDFFGLNHYSTRWATGKVLDCPNRFEFLFGGVEHVTERDGVPIGNRGHDGHPFDVPWGLKSLLHYVKRTYSKDLPVYITENGFAASNEAKMSLKEIVDDTQRQAYFEGYIKATLDAVKEGVPVKGYLAWSLLDNLEWSSGYDPRFGVTHVDRENGFKRTPKDSTKLVKAIFDHVCS